MLKKTSLRLAFLMTSTLCLAVASAQDLSPAEREKGLAYLAQTREGVVSAAKGLSEAQWTFRPGADRWSVAEVVEHLAVVEEMVHGILLKLDQSPAAPPDRNVKEIDARILAEVPDRSTKVKAPPQITPSGRWTSTGALDHFLTARTEVTEFLRSNHDLRAHVVNHPVLGPLDGYEWILTLAAHTERHTKQILEVKADPRFPAN